MLRKELQKINRLSFFVKALLFSMPLTGALLAYLISIGAADLIFSDWFITLISIPNFFANPITTSTYFGNFFDMVRQFKQQPSRYRELIGTALGIAGGIAIGVGLSVMHVPVPLTASLCAFANVLFTFRQINIFTGLGSRIGVCTDEKNPRPTSEKVMILSGGFFGLVLGAVLFGTCTAAMISVVGITAFFSGGVAIPAWIAGIIFILSVSSGIAASADYTSKGISFIQSQLAPQSSQSVSQMVQRRKCEYAGSCAGVSLGLLLGVIAVTAIAIANPPLLAGIIGIVAGALIIITAAATVGSIASRIGRIMDECRQNQQHERTTDDSIPQRKRRFSVANENAYEPTFNQRRLLQPAATHPNAFFNKSVTSLEDDSFCPAPPSKRRRYI